MLRCPYCGTPIEVVEEICLHCDRPLDAQRLRAQQRELEQKLAELKQKLAEQAADPVIAAKMAQLHPPWNPQARQAMRWILAGEGRVLHWTYREAEWQQFVRQSWHWTNLRILLIAVCFPFSLLLVVGLLFLWASHGDPSLLTALAVGLGTIAAISGGLFLANVGVLLVRRRPSRFPREAYISRVGLILNGRYRSLHRLYGVDCKRGDPPVLRFFTGSGQYGGSMLEVPVPAGSEAEAERVVNDFKAKRP